MSFHIETIPNRRGRDTILFREAWRDGLKVRKRTIANLTYLPPAVIDGFRAVLRGGIVLGSPDQVFGIRRPLPHGHAAAVLQKRVFELLEIKPPGNVVSSMTG